MEQKTQGEKNGLSYSHLILTKIPKIYTGKKKESSINSAGETVSHVEEWNQIPTA